MLRVLHLADRLSALGGADRHMLGILEHLQGRATTLLAFGRDDGSLPDAERRRIGPLARCKGLERGGLSSKGRQGSRTRLSRLIADFRPDVIHVHNIVDPALTDLAAESAPSLAIVQDHRPFCPGRGMLRPGGEICTRPQGDHCEGCFDDPAYYQALARLTRRRLKALARMGRVLVLSRYMAGMLVRAGLNARRISVLPPFVHRIDAPARTGPGEYHLLACRLVQSKGVGVALEAAEMLPEAGPPLWVAGSGPLADEVQRRAGDSGGRIVYMGWHDRRGMSELLSGAGSLWLPSLWAEPFGIVGLEALHLGVPAIASDVGGVADWLDDGKNGFLVPPGDPAGLARAAMRLEDAGLVQKMGGEGQKTAAARFDADSLMDRLVSIYEALAA